MLFITEQIVGINYSNEWLRNNREQINVGFLVNICLL